MHSIAFYLTVNAVSIFFMKTITIMDKHGENFAYFLYTSGHGCISGVINLQNESTYLKNDIFIRISLEDVVRIRSGEEICVIQESNYEITTTEARKLYENNGFLYSLMVSGNSLIFRPIAEAVRKFLDNIPQNSTHDADFKKLLTTAWDNAVYLYNDFTNALKKNI